MSQVSQDERAGAKIEPREIDDALDTYARELLRRALAVLHRYEAAPVLYDDIAAYLAPQKPARIRARLK